MTAPMIVKWCLRIMLSHVGSFGFPRIVWKLLLYVVSLCKTQRPWAPFELTPVRGEVSSGQQAAVGLEVECTAPVVQ